MDREPLRPTDARRRIRDILEQGDVVFTDPHAYQELANDGLETTDAVNVLRAGVVGEPEWENRAWRYRVSTARICVVIEFAGEDRLVVITAWRIKR